MAGGEIHHRVKPRHVAYYSVDQLQVKRILERRRTGSAAGFHDAGAALFHTASPELQLHGN
jgi:hypothetical protein